MRLHQGWIATICSFFFVGLGQLVNRDYKKLAIFWSVYAALYIYSLLILQPLLLVEDSILFSIFLSPEFLIWGIILTAVWLLSMEDAWRAGCKKEHKKK
jgi:hypothetical protein